MTDTNEPTPPTEPGAPIEDPFAPTGTDPVEDDDDADDEA